MHGECCRADEGKINALRSEQRDKLTWRVIPMGMQSAGQEVRPYLTEDWSASGTEC